MAGDGVSPEWRALMEQKDKQYEIQEVRREEHHGSRSTLFDYVLKGPATQVAKPKKENRRSKVVSQQSARSSDASPRNKTNESLKSRCVPLSPHIKPDSLGIDNRFSLSRLQRENEVTTESIATLVETELNAYRDGINSMDAGFVDREAPAGHPPNSVKATCRITRLSPELSAPAERFGAVADSVSLSTPIDCHFGRSGTQIPTPNSKDDDLINSKGVDNRFFSESTSSPGLKKRHMSRLSNASASETKRRRKNTSVEDELFVHGSDSTEDLHLTSEDLPVDSNPPIAYSRDASQIFVPKMDPKDPDWFEKYADWAKSRKKAVVEAAENKQGNLEQPRKHGSGYKVSEHLQKGNSCMAFCGRPDEAEPMVKCKTHGHEDRRYHLGCVDLKKPPDKDEPWFCPDCEKSTARNSAKHPVFSRHATSAILPGVDTFKAEQASFRGIKERGLRSWTSQWSVQEEQCVLDIIEGIINEHEREHPPTKNANPTSEAPTNSRSTITGRFRSLGDLFGYVSQQLWDQYGIERNPIALRSRWDGVSGLRNRCEAAVIAEERAKVRRERAVADAAAHGVPVSTILGSTGSAGGVKQGGPILEGLAPGLRAIRGIPDLDRRLKQALESKGEKGAGPGQCRERKKVGSWGKNWTGQDDRGATGHRRRSIRARERGNRQGDATRTVEGGHTNVDMGN